MSKTKQGGRKPSRRQLRYGRLVRGWDYRWLPELRDQAEQARKQAGISRTEFIEQAIQLRIAAANNASTRTGSDPAAQSDTVKSSGSGDESEPSNSARR